MNNIITSKSIKEPVDVKLVVSVVLLSLMVLMRDLGYLSISPLLFVLVVTLICVILPQNSLEPFFFLYTTVGIAIYGITLIPILLLLIIKNKKINIFQFIFPIIILLFELIHLLGIPSGVDFNKYIVYALNIFLFFFLLFDDKQNDLLLKKQMRYYIIGITITSLIIFIHSVLNFGFQDVVFESFRMGASFEDYDAEKEMVTMMNPNQLAFFSITAFSLLLFIKDIFQYKLTKVLLLLYLVFIGILSGSRTWIIIMAVLLLLYFTLSEMRGRFSLIIMTIVVFFVALQYGNYSDAVYTRYENRFDEAGMSTAGHRTEILKEYNKWLIENPQRFIYGAGALYYNSVANILYSTHNSTQQIVVSYGFIGLLLFLYCIMVFNNRYLKRKRTRFWYFVPFVICFLFSQSGQFLNPPCMMFPFVVTALPLKLIVKE